MSGGEAAIDGQSSRDSRARLKRSGLAPSRSPSFRLTHTSSGQANAAKVQAARIAEIGRSKNGRIEPSDLISEVTNACSTIVPMTMPSTMAATG